VNKGDRDLVNLVRADIQHLQRVKVQTAELSQIGQTVLMHVKLPERWEVPQDNWEHRELVAIQAQIRQVVETNFTLVEVATE
jgi:hypothetical protein